MMDWEPIKWQNGRGKIKWQPQLNGQQLWKRKGWSYRGGSYPVLTSYRKAVRLAKRHAKQQANKYQRVDSE